MAYGKNLCTCTGQDGTVKSSMWNCVDTSIHVMRINASHWISLIKWYEQMQVYSNFSFVTSNKSNNFKIFLILLIWLYKIITTCM